MYFVFFSRKTRHVFFFTFCNKKKKSKILRNVCIVFRMLNSKKCKSLLPQSSSHVYTRYLQNCTVVEKTKFLHFSLSRRGMINKPPVCITIFCCTKYIRSLNKCIHLVESKPAIVAVVFSFPLDSNKLFGGGKLPAGTIIKWRKLQWEDNVAKKKKAEFNNSKWIVV